jgi:hypothetical protein
MATKRFFGFSEDGTLTRIKGRILRFLDAEPADNDDKVAIRASLSVPALSEGLTPVNNLSDVSNASTSRDNLGVPSDDELARATGSKLVGPSISFDGTNDYIVIADSDKLTFTSTSDLGDSSGVWTATTNLPAITDGTGTLDDNYKITTTGTVAQGASTLSIINGVSATAGQVVYYDGSVWRLKDSDDLPFSISGWVNMDDATDFCPLSKYGGGTSTQEWLFYLTTDKPTLFLKDAAGVSVTWTATNALTSYENSWIHLLVTYNGAGPSSSNSFTSAMDGVVVFLNGEAIAGTAANNGSYAGMSNTTQPINIGRYANGVFAEGQIKDIKLFNRKLSATEVTTLYNEGQLGLEDQWGGGLGDTYTSDFSAGVDGFYDNQATVAGNIDSIGGQDDNLRLTVNTVNTSHYAQKAAFSANKRYRTSFDYYIPSTNSHVDGLEFWIGATAVSGEAHSPSLDTWLSISGEAISNNTTLYVYVTDGGSRLVNDAGGDDVIYIRNVTVTQIGTLVDIRAENFNEAAGEIYDMSDNGFIGTNNGASVVGGRKHVKAASLDLTGIPTSSAGLSTGEVYSNAGVLTIV